MEIREMNTDELQLRKNAIAEELEAEGADLDALEAEVKGINEELEARKEEEAQKAEIREAIANDEIPVEVIEKPIIQEERKEMSNIEIRNTAEYIEAFAEYVKSGNDAECRALLSENATGGTVPVPEFVYEIVKHAWEKDGIMSRVRKAYVKGNLKVGFEISGSAATKHAEGVAVDEETLTLGIVELVPASIKKWVSVSDEALDTAEEFLRYVYEELTYRIAKKAADELVAGIIACDTASTTTCPGVPIITQSSIGLGTIAAAMAQISDEAAAPVVMMNKLTWGAIKAVAATNSYGYDPFEGLDVVFNNTIKAFSAASTGDTYIIVGDLDQGALANFPAGDSIKFKLDENTLATSDLVRVIGRLPIGIGVVAPNAFCKVVK